MSTVSEPIRAGAEVFAAQERPMVYGMPGGNTMHIYDALFSLSGPFLKSFGG